MSKKKKNAPNTSNQTAEPNNNAMTEKQQESSDQADAEREPPIASEQAKEDNSAAHQVTSSETSTIEKSVENEADLEPLANSKKRMESEEKNASAEDTQNASKGLSWLITLISMAALLTSGWVAYWQWQQKQQLMTSLQDSEKTILSQNNTITQLTDRMEQQQQKVTQQQSVNQSITQQQQSLRQQLTVTQDKLRLLSSEGRQEWLIEQALYLIALAQQKLIFEHQTQTPMALLVEADNALAQAGDLNLSSIRQAINDDITSLAAMPQTDTAGILHRLNSLQNQISNLTPLAIQLPKEQEEQSSSDKPWLDRFMQTLDNFGEEAFKFRTHDDKIQPLLTKEQKSILQNLLQLTLTQAQSGALQADSQYFQSRIDFASTLISEYFQLNDSANAIVDQLQQLKETPLAEPIEYNLKALSLLQQLKEERRLKWYSQQPKNAIDQLQQPKQNDHQDQGNNQ